MKLELENQCSWKHCLNKNIRPNKTFNGKKCNKPGKCVNEYIILKALGTIIDRYVCNDIQKLPYSLDFCLH